MPLKVLGRGPGFKVLWSRVSKVDGEKGRRELLGREDGLGKSGGSGDEEQWNRFRWSTVT